MAQPTFQLLEKSLLAVPGAYVAMLVDGAFPKEQAFSLLSFLSSRLLNHIPAFVWDGRSSANELLSELLLSNFVSIIKDHSIVIVVCSKSAVTVAMPEQVSIVPCQSFTEAQDSLWTTIAAGRTNLVAFPQPIKAFYHRASTVTVIFGPGNMDGRAELVADVCRVVQYGHPVFLHLDHGSFSALAESIADDFKTWVPVRDAVQGAHALIVYMHKRAYLDSVFKVSNRLGQLSLGDMMTQVMTVGADPLLLYNFPCEPELVPHELKVDEPVIVRYPSDRAKCHIQSRVQSTLEVERVPDITRLMPPEFMDNIAVKFPRAASDVPTLTKVPCVIGGRTVLQLVVDRNLSFPIVLRKEGFLQVRVPDAGSARKGLLTICSMLCRGSTVTLSGLEPVMTWDEAFWCGLLASQLFGARKVYIEWTNGMASRLLEKCIPEHLDDLYAHLSPDSKLMVLDRSQALVAGQNGPRRHSSVVQ